MLRIISSNRQEALLDALAQRLRTPADANPLTPERVVAERGMNTWVMQQLAERHGIAANIDFQLPAAFVWQGLRALLPGIPRQSQFDVAPLTWRLMRLLPSLLRDPAFWAIDRYLRDDADGRKRYQLCGRVATVLNDYLVYRPGMILGWSKGQRSTGSPDEDWQLRLWQAVTRELGDGHRARLLERFAALPDSAVAAAPALPRRVSVFGVPALPPVYVEALARLSRTRNVDLYVLNPSEQFWGDLVDPKSLATDPEALVYAHDLSNRLLASWGQPVRFFLSELYSHAAEYVDAWDEPGEPATVLQRLQADLRDLTETTGLALDTADRSLCIARCWGPLREIEALHDWLVGRFQADESLRPRDVVVLAPDIDQLAPYVDAVFGAAEGTSRYLPWTLVDVPPRAMFPLLAVVEQLLRLPDSRLTVSEVLGLLETPAIARRFELGDADVSALREAVRAVHAHWALDAAMQWEVLGGPADQRAAGECPHTWQSALRRLFLGVAMPAQDAPVHGVTPAPLFEGHAAAALGHLQAFVDRLAYWRRALAAERPPADWVGAVHALTDDLLDAADPDDEAALEQVAAALGDFDREAGEGDFGDALSPVVFRDDLLARLATPGARGRLFDGRITIGALTPMRSAPFRLVAVVGLNSDTFPRSQVAAGFDLIAQDPRPGDRSRRLDDRHLFLEILLSAREALYLSYTGHHARDGSAAQPSVVVSELIDYAVRMHGGEPERDRVTRHLVVEHPLQPFSRRYFEKAAGEDARLVTFDTDWVAPAREAACTRVAPAPFCTAPLPAADGDGPAEITLAALTRFLRHPTAFFLRERLGILTWDEDDTLSDDEPFALGTLEAYQLESEWLEERLGGRTEAAHGALLRARGDLPAGWFGDVAWQTVADAVAPLADVLAPQLAVARQVPVDLEIAGARVVGTLRRATPQGLVRYTVATLKPKHLLDAWVEHLALLAVAPEGIGLYTRVVARDRTFVLGAVDEPAGKLAALVQLYAEGLREPLPFFPASAHDWAVNAADPDKARRKAMETWQGNEFLARQGVTPECADPANRIGWGHRDDPFAPRFVALAQAIYEPLLAAGQKARTA
jgi:exodeoxyribonuclease V gamma subunit